MAVGNLLDPYNPGIWWVDDEGTLYQVRLDGQAPNLHAVNLTIAGNIARVSIDADGNVWTVTRDGHVLRGEASEDVTPPRRATNVAAVPGGDAYVIGAQQASGITTSAGFIPPAGNEIWFWNHLTKTWSLIPGWGVAIDADNDGNLWIVDENGKVWNRGGRKFGFWELRRRTRPTPTENWCDYDADVKALAAKGVLADFLASGKLPPLLSDAVQRFAEGGASTLRLSQSFTDPDQSPIVLDAPALVIAAVLGINVFLLIDVIRTGIRVVPAGKGLESASFDSPAMIDTFNSFFTKYVAAVDDLFQKVGLPQRFEDVVKYISVGGEVDVLLNDKTLTTGTDEWDSWIGFYRNVSSSIRTLVPLMKIGCVVTAPGASWMFNMPGAYRTWLDSLNETSDYIGFTSYPDMGTNLDPSNDLVQRIERMLQIAGDKPVIAEEFGYPTYDALTRAALHNEYPGHVFPTSFYEGPADLSCSLPGKLTVATGICRQKRAVELAFGEWDKAKLRLPVIVWFTAFAMHTEGKGCTPRTLPLPPHADPDYFAEGIGGRLYACQPCVHGTDNLLCRPCGDGEGIDWLGTGVDERSERFFGSCGLIRSNGVPKEGWNELVAETEQRRFPRGP